MRLSAAALSILLLAALAGCDKRQSTPNRASQEAAASTKSPSPVKVMEAPATATATTATGGEAGSCGGEAGGSCCGGEADMCAGGCTKWDDAAGEVAKRTVPANARWKTIKVSGMTCGGCERRIIANLGKLDGVLAVEADAEMGEVRVAMAQDADLRTAAIERINSLGYSAQ